MPDSEKQGAIAYVESALLTPEILNSVIYPCIERTHYWSDSWDPEFYIALARAGFISVSVTHSEFGALLIPEIQREYAVLDWGNLHCSRNLRRLMTGGRLQAEGVELRVASPSRVVDRLQAYHGAISWLTEPYQKLVQKLSLEGSPEFAIHGIELWSTRSNTLLAGELGYSTGAVYTSLSGFCSREDRRWRHVGTLQQLLLAIALKQWGFHFWNMGHALPYKKALGAEVLPRPDFLRRWCEARDGVVVRGLQAGDLLVDAGGIADIVTSFACRRKPTA